MKVKGRDGLVRDTNSRAIINRDKSALANARRAKALKLSQIKREEALEDRIHRLEKTVELLLTRIGEG